MSNEEFDKFVLRLSIDIGDDEELLKKFREVGEEIIKLTGIRVFHKTNRANEISVIVLSEIIEWLTFDRQSVLSLAFKKLKEFVKSNEFSDEDLLGFLSYLESSFSQMRDVWNKTSPSTEGFITDGSNN